MRFLFVAAMLAAAWAVAPAARAGVQPDPARSVPGSVPTDTLRYRVPAGEALIVTLPSGYRGGEAQYRIVRAPALSWLVDRSFFWQTRRGDHGVMLVELERTMAGRAPEPVVLRIELVGG